MKNLEVYQLDTVIFSSDGAWLHPLFELMDYIEREQIPPETLTVHDKLIGRGAAVLLASMGIPACHGRVMSRRALPVLKRYGISYSYDTLVDSLQCMTESVLTDDMPLQAALEELQRRAGRS